MTTEKITPESILEFKLSPEAEGLELGELLERTRQMIETRDSQQATPTDTVDTGDAVDGEGVLPVEDTRPVSGRGEGRAAFQTPQGPDSVFSPEFQPGEVEEEATKAFAGGVLKTLDSITTFPERMQDMASGEMDKQGDDYEPDWSFSKQFDIEPIVLKSAWGPYLESITHYSSLATGIVGAIAASPFSLPTIGGGASLVSKVGTGLLQGATVGAAQDALSIQSHEQNASRMLIDRWPVMERLVGPLATKDADSALAIWFKNIAEGLGFEMLIGGTWELLGQGLSKATRVKSSKNNVSSALAKLEDVANQTKAKGKAEFDEQDQFLRTISELEQRQLGGEVIDMDSLPPSPYIGVRGSKNKPIVAPHQGAAISRSTPYDNWRNLTRIENDGNRGSVDALLSSLEAEDIATTGWTKQLINKFKKKLVDDPRFKEVVTKAKKQGRSTYSTFKNSFDRYRDLAGLRFNNPKKDWDAFLKRTGLNTEDILNFDNIINSEFKIIRDVSIAARELKKMGGNIFDVDGPMKTIADRMVVAFDLLNYNRAVSRSTIKNADKLLPGIHKESLEGVDVLMHFLEKDAPEELIDEVLNFLSTSHKSGDISNFNKWMRQKMIGGDMLPGRNKQGALLDELSTIHINSMFGPKTAQRAIWGTGFNSYLNQFHDTLGAALRYPVTRDAKQFKAQFASLMSMFEFIPDAFKVFKTNINDAFRADAVIDTRFSQYGKRHLNDTAWEQWLALEGTEADDIVWNMWKTAHNLNGDSKLGVAASGIGRVMDAGDKTFSELTRHRRVKEIAMRDALTAQQKGDISEITEEVLDAAGQLYEQKYFDEFGDIDIKREAFTSNDFDEVTYRTELRGASKAFAEFINQVPLMKPYFRFVRSGINGLTVKTKGMPFLAGLVEKERDIFFASPEDLSKVLQYGIDNAWDLEKSKARQWSRQAVGMGLVFIAGQKFLAGGLSGNGPNNTGMRNLWRDTGWERNTIEIGGKRVSLELFEPFDLLLKGVADIGDNMALMGPEWAEDKLTAFAIATAFSEAATNQTYLSALGDLVDVLRGEPGAVGRMTGNLSNFVPFGGWRRWAGQGLTNQYREINSSIWSDTGILNSSPVQNVRRNNLATEFLTDDPLPLKHNLLNGQPFKATGVMGRLWRATSFVAIEPDASPGQKLLWRSNYDLRVSTWNSPGPDDVSLKDHPKLRSELGRQMGLVKIGGQNLEEWLNWIAVNDKRVLASVDEMIRDQKSGNIDIDPLKSYYHNRIIRKRFERVRKEAWSIVRDLPEARDLILEKQDLEVRSKQKLYKTSLQELPLHPGR